MNSIIEPIRFIEKKQKVVELEGVKKDMYYVSNDGVVVNKRGKVIKPDTINTGYQVYRLYSGHPAPGKYKHVLAHRLVMQTFQPIENPENMTVNHKDADKQNNFEYNLEWVSQKENNDHGVMIHKKYGSNRYNAMLKKEQLQTVVEELNKGTKYSEILNILGIEDTENNRDYIGNIKRGKTYSKEIEELGLTLVNGSSTIEI